MTRFFDWTPNDNPGVIYYTNQEKGWEELRDRFTPKRHDPPFEQIISIAKKHGVQSVLEERRYIDPDFRDEHHRFYSTTYRRYPTVCHRLHFFVGDLRPDLTNLGALKDGYCGYSVMRPLDHSPVGRTMLRPPPELGPEPGKKATVCSVTDNAHVFGHTFTVEGMPFMSQDAQYLRCAHAVQWMVLYHAFLAERLPRRCFPGDIHNASLGGFIVGRQLPSEGLSLPQLLGGLHALGLSPTVRPLPKTRDDSRAESVMSLFDIICRYVNSQMPPIVAAPEHVWVIVGYKIKGPGRTHDNAILYRHDDARGPYIRVDDPWNEPEDMHSPWICVIPPLPPSVYMSAEDATLLGSDWLRRFPQIIELDRKNQLTYRTYGIRSYIYKKGIDGRVHDKVADLYRLAIWPRRLWIVEAVDRSRRDRGQACVHGEAVIDPTGHYLAAPDRTIPDLTAPDLAASHESALLALHIPEFAWAKGPDYGKLRRVHYDGFSPYDSGCRQAPWSAEQSCG